MTGWSATRSRRRAATAPASLESQRLSTASTASTNLTSAVHLPRPRTEAVTASNSRPVLSIVRTRRVDRRRGRAGRGRVRGGPGCPAGRGGGLVERVEAELAHVERVEPRTSAVAWPSAPQGAPVPPQGRAAARRGWLWTFETHDHRSQIPRRPGCAARRWRPRNLNARPGTRSRPTAATRSVWLGCCASGNCPRSGCPPRPRKQPGIWSEPARTPAAISCAPDIGSPSCCCARAWCGSRPPGPPNMSSGCAVTTSPAAGSSWSTTRPSTRC
jgi:hypothetical protein